jgi:ferritin
VFRVLTTPRSERRVGHLRELARKADDKQTGSALFWFVKEEDYDPHKSDSTWGTIWRTAKDDKQHHLLEESIA